MGPILVTLLITKQTRNCQEAPISACEKGEQKQQGSEQIVRMLGEDVQRDTITDKACEKGGQW